MRTAATLLLILAGACESWSEAAPGQGPRCLEVDDGYGPTGKRALHVELVASGLEVPWGLAFLPDRSMLVTERRGRIVRIVGGKLAEIARVPVAQHTESGLLGLALHPDFARTSWFYVYYTHDTPRGPRNRVERWTLSEDRVSATPDRVIVDDIPSAPFHDGGRIAFGPDGKLYVGTGDSTQPDLAQDRASLAGKILRIEPDGTIPRDNPVRGSPVYVSGVRNAEAFDWRDGVLVVADHGPSGELGRRGHDEVSIARPGANLGWPAIYGCEARMGLVTPILTWTEAVPPGGAVFYDGGSIADWRGDFLIGTLGSRHLHRVRIGRDGRLVEHDVQLADHGRLRTLVIGPDRELYVTTSNCDGRGTCPRERDVILRVTQ